MPNDHHARGVTTPQSAGGENKISTRIGNTNETTRKESKLEKVDKFRYSEKSILKGKAAESVCERYFNSLEDCSFVYNSKSGHDIDFSVIENLSGFPYTYMVEVKLMRQRDIYLDYGINRYQYDKYVSLQKRLEIPVKIYFIDYSRGMCVGGDLDVLCQHYTKCTPYGKMVVYPLNVTHKLSGELRDWIHFPPEYVKEIFPLLPEEIDMLEKLVK